MINYSKIFMTIFCLFFLSNCVFAETWKNASMENNKTVYIDVDSVNSHNDSIYYNVKYFNEKNGFEEISTVQSQGNKAGIISTCKYTDYLKDKSCANPLTNSTLSVLDDISVKSFLYNANETAKLTLFKKNHTTNKIDIAKEKFYSGKIMDMDSYQKKIAPIWKRISKGKSRNIVTVLITFDKNGKLISCLISKSGGDEENEAAIKAVHQVGNIEALPKDFPNEYIDISFTFDGSQYYHNPFNNK